MEEQEVKVETKEVKPVLVKSFKIAESLCADYPYFGLLIGIRIDKFDPNKKRHVYFFKRTPQLEKTVAELIENAKKAKAERNKQADS